LIDNCRARFSSWRAAGDGTAKQSLQAGEKFRSARRPARALRVAQRFKAVFGGAFQQGLEVGDAVQHRPHAHQGVVHPREMGANAGPWPIPGARHQTGPRGVQAHISGGRDKMILVHRDRGKPTLKEMSRPSATRVDEVGLSTVRPPDRPAQTLRRSRRQDQVNVAPHQAIGPDLDVRLARLLDQQIA
jgi:hypothetical protein